MRDSGRRLAIQGWALGLALVSLGCDQSNPNLDRYEVSGYVVDAIHGHGVGGARVVFTSDTLYTASTRTESNGYYALSVETDTDLGRVRAEKSGYAPAEESVFFDTRRVRKDVTLSPAPPAP